MMRVLFSRKVNRRQFLTTGSGILLGILSACTRRRRLIDSLANQSSTNPTPTGETIQILSAEPAAEASGTADTILINGDIWTMDSAGSKARALAIRQGRILAVGTDDVIRPLASPTANLIDAGGRVITPGMIDPHVHFRLIGLDYVYYTPFMPPEVKDVASLQRALKEVVRTKKPGEWIIAYYLVLTDQMIPDKSVLDAVTPDNPVFLMHIGGHWGTANSVAMQIAGVTSGTASPVGGVIEKDASGQPTGVCYNHRAMDVLRKDAPPVTQDLVIQSILNTQQLMAACGVTSYHDNNLRGIDHIQAYQQLAKEGKITLRHTLYLTLEWPQDMDKLAQVEHYQDDFSRFAGIKFLIDGQTPTAYCHQPHDGASWDMPTWEPQMFKDTVRTLHDMGLQISTHCVGDAAADLALDAYEAAQNANPRPDPRHRLEHLILTTPDATRRMKDLGVIASVNPHFLYMAGDSYKNIFGDERSNRIIVTREWLDAGVHLTIGSDAPSVPFHHPQATMAGGIGRYTLSKQILNPDQCLTFAEALRAHTIEAAYAAHDEQELGSLEPGKFADLVIWKEDPSSLRVGELAQTEQVKMTMVGGNVIYGG
jgi:predicted amidohydrolase YtcJ